MTAPTLDYYNRQGPISDNASDATFTTQGGQHPMGKGERLYTGPGGVRDYRAHVVTDDRMVGIGTMSPEGTSDSRYIWRGATGAPPPRPRSQWAGEIGWHVPFIDWANVTSGHQMTRSTFRQAQEDKFTHRWQEPWYPAPNQPEYPKMFPMTKGNPQGTVFLTQSKHPYSFQSRQRRPHTVASFRYDDNRSLPNLDSVPNQRSGYSSDYTGSSQSLNMPASGSYHSQAVGNSRPASNAGYHSGVGNDPRTMDSQRATPVNSRPTSGTAFRSITPASYYSDGGLSQNRPASLQLSRSGNSSAQSRFSESSSRRASGQPPGREGSRHASHRSVSRRRGVVPAATSLHRPANNTKN